MNELLRNGCLLLGMAFLPACQSESPVEGLNLTMQTKPLPLIATIGKAIQKCWFKSGHAAFKPFRMADESNSYAGRPRLLLVPKNNPAGLPKLVIQAENTKGTTNLQVYGPLLSTAIGKRINGDIRRWSAGNTSCQAS